MNYRKIIILLVCWISILGVKGQSLMEKSLKLDDTKDMTLQYFLDQVAAKTGISISYSSNLLDVDRKVKFTGREITLGQYLKKAIEGQLIEIVELTANLVEELQDK